MGIFVHYVLPKYHSKYRVKNGRKRALNSKFVTKEQNVSNLLHIGQNAFKMHPSKKNCK